MWQALKRFYHRMGSPKWFFEISGKWSPWFLLTGVLLMAVGLALGLAYAPADYQQGDSFRIIYIHVPSSILSQSAYILMAVAGLVGLVWKMKVSFVVAKAIAPIGATMAIMALVTGAIWGEKTWGTWWVWDARLTSMLVLLFLYVGVIALHSAIDNEEMANKATAILALVGTVNIPIIKLSVYMATVLHQKATITLTKKPTMATEMLIPLLCSIVAFYCLFAFWVIARTRNELLWKERRTNWVKTYVSQQLSQSGK